MTNSRLPVANCQCHLVLVPVRPDGNQLFRSVDLEPFDSEEVVIGETVLQLDIHLLGLFRMLIPNRQCVAWKNFGECFRVVEIGVDGVGVEAVITGKREMLKS